MLWRSAFKQDMENKATKQSGRLPANAETTRSCIYDRPRRMLDDSNTACKIAQSQQRVSLHAPVLQSGLQCKLPKLQRQALWFWDSPSSCILQVLWRFLKTARVGGYSSNAIFWMEVSSPQVAEAEEDVTDLKVLRTGTTPFAKMDYQAWMGISSGFKGAYMSTHTFYVNWDYHASVLLRLWCAVLNNLNLHASCSWFFRSSLAKKNFEASNDQMGHLTGLVKSCNSDFAANVFPSAWMFTCMDHVGQFGLPALAVLPQKVLREGKCQETQMGDLVRCRIGCGLGGFDFDWWQVFARKYAIKLYQCHPKWSNPLGGMFLSWPGRIEGIDTSLIIVYDYNTPIVYPNCGDFRLLLPKS